MVLDNLHQRHDRSATKSSEDAREDQPALGVSHVLVGNLVGHSAPYDRGRRSTCCREEREADDSRIENRFAADDICQTTVHGSHDRLRKEIAGSDPGVLRRRGVQVGRYRWQGDRNDLYCQMITSDLL